MNEQGNLKDGVYIELQTAMLSDIMDISYLQRLQDLFADVHGVASVITDTKGKPITRVSNFTRLCKNIIRRTEKGSINCFRSDAIIGRHNPAGAIVQPCHSCGLWDAGVSITVGGQHIASWLIGQVRNEQVNEQQMLLYAEEIGADKDEFKAALREVPTMSAQQFQKIADLLFVIANELSEKAFSNMQLKKQIEENEKITARLLEREENLATTLHSIGDGVISTDKNGLIVNMNPVAEKLCGWMLAETAGKPLTEVFNIISSENREIVADPVKKVLQSGEIIGLANHTVLLSKNGAEYQIADSAAPIKNKEGEITGVVLVFSDVTEKYKAQQLINDNEVRFRGLLENLETGIVVHAPDTTLLLSNTRASELLGLTKEQMCGKRAIDPAWKFVKEDETPLSFDDYPVNRIANDKKPIKNQLVGIYQPGKNDIVWVTVNGFPILDDKGNITEIAISFINVSERKQAEDALRSSIYELKKSQEVAKIGNWIWHVPQNYVEWSDEMYKIFGIDKQLFTGDLTQVINNCIHPDDREEVYRSNTSVMEQNTPIPVEYRIIRPNGSIRTVWAEAGELELDKAGNPMLLRGIVHDITERKQAEESVHLNEEKLKSIFRVVPTGIGVVINRTLTEVNPKVSEMTGYSPEEILGRNAQFLYPSQEEYDFVGREKYRQIALYGTGSVQTCWKRKDGKLINILLSSTPVDNDDLSKGVTFTALDITERIKSEQEIIAAKEKAEESDRLKSAFLANMSHEIRTPMNGILGFADLLKTPDLTGEEQQAYITVIKKSGVRMLNIINNIVDISKIEAGLMIVDTKESNINEQLVYIYTFFMPEVEAKNMTLKLKKPLVEKEVIVRTDREKLYSILTNLVKNAIKYTEQGSIELGYDLIRKHDCESMLQFFVKDTGIGIPKDRQEAIFERFIQADVADRMAYQGAGLGLAITKAYVEMLGGTIWVESEEGKGSTFYFTLPCNASPNIDSLEQPTFGTSRKSSHKLTTEKEINEQPTLGISQNLQPNITLEKEINEQHYSFSTNSIDTTKLKILITEDDEVSEMLLENYIRPFGGEILKARTGVEAIEACRNHPDIHLILMDIRMPDMGGYEATKRIREFNKEVIIIAQTAFGLTRDREKAMESGCNDYLSKPISKIELQEMIEKYFSN